MFIKKLSLLDYGTFRRADVSLWSEAKPDRKITVLIGENGAGKSTFLEGIATLLSWLAARIRNKKNAGSPIGSLKIYSGAPAAVLGISLYAKGQDYHWQLAKIAKGKRAKFDSNLKEVTLFSNTYSEELTQNDSASLPLIGYYPTERYVLDIPKKIKTKHAFKQINGYETALTKGIDFRRFFEWFRDREDIRNEGKIDFSEVIPFLDRDQFLTFLNEHMSDKGISGEKIFSFIDESKLKQNNPSLYRRVQNREVVENDPQYFAVLRALESFMPEYTGLRIERKPRMRMIIDKQGQPFDILQLSQGEKSLLALIGDIARRLAIMNPALENPLQGEGIILIDEIDLHLHPRWQRTIVRRLRETFPNCQFILTTHSPLVISDPDNIQVLALKDGNIYDLPNLYGMDVEQVFLEVMHTPLRNPDLQEKIDDLLDAIQDRNMDKANMLRKELGNILPPDHRELVRADIYLRRQEAIHAKNH